MSRADVPQETVNSLGQPVGWPVNVREAPQPSVEPLVGQHFTVVSLDPRAHSAGLFAAYTAAPDDGDWTYLPYGPFDELASFRAFTEAYADRADPVFFTVLDLAGQPVGVAST